MKDSSCVFVKRFPGDPKQYMLLVAHRNLVAVSGAKDSLYFGQRVWRSQTGPDLKGSTLLDRFPGPRKCYKVCVGMDVINSLVMGAAVTTGPASWPCGIRIVGITNHFLISFLKILSSRVISWIWPVPVAGEFKGSRGKHIMIIFLN